MTHSDQERYMNVYKNVNHTKITLALHLSPDFTEEILAII